MNKKRDRFSSPIFEKCNESAQTKNNMRKMILYSSAISLKTLAQT